MDISATGSVVTFTPVRGGKGFQVTHFSDDGTPFDAPDITASNNKRELNGQMISSRTPSVFSFSITVIPGSAEDDNLWNILKQSAIQPGSISPVRSLYWNVTVAVPKIDDSGSGAASRKFTYSNARIVSGPTGPSTSAEGRLAARTYTFEAEGLS